MASNLEDAELQRRNLVADVAHELRTLVSNIQGNLDALKDGLLQPNETTIATIQGQVIHLGHLVEDLRLLSQSEAGALQLNRAPGRMQDVLWVCVEAVRPRAEAKGITLNLESILCPWWRWTAPVSLWWLTICWRMPSFTHRVAAASRSAPAAAAQPVQKRSGLPQPTPDSVSSRKT